MKFFEMIEKLTQNGMEIYRLEYFKDKIYVGVDLNYGRMSNTNLKVKKIDGHYKTEGFYAERVHIVDNEEQLEQVYEEFFIDAIAYRTESKIFKSPTKFLKAVNSSERIWRTEYQEDNICALCQNGTEFKKYVLTPNN
jgi:hypothetical protein